MCIVHYDSSQALLSSRYYVKRSLDIKAVFLWIYCCVQGPGDGVAVTLDNMKAMMSRDKGEKDLASSHCVFAQAYRQLCDTDPKLLRTVWDGERVFQVN